MKDFFILITIAAVFVLLRLLFLDLPMERDEGEFATIGLGMLQGIPPYLDSYTMKFPGGASLYALSFALWGPSPESIRIAHICFNAATLILIGLLGRKFFNEATGRFAAAAFGTLSLGLGSYGLWLSAEHFAIFFLVLGGWLLGQPTKPLRTWRFILGGLSFGTSILCKHHALFPSLAWIGLYALIHVRLLPRSSFLSASRRVALMFFCYGLPLAILMGTMKWLGVFHSFWFWTVKYASTYASSVPLPLGWEHFKIGAWRVFLDGPCLWLMSLVGLGIGATEMILERKRLLNADLPSTISAALLGVVFLAALLAASAGLLFRGQYFIYALPFASLLAGVAWSRIQKHFPFHSPKNIAILLALLVASFIVLTEPVLHGIHHRPHQLVRLVYGMNPFPEYTRIAKWISEKTRPEDKVLVAGSEPSLYFLSKRRPAIPYLCVYEFMKNHPSASKMQREAIEKAKATQPPVIVYVDVPTSWGDTPASDRTFQNWLREELNRNYRLDGIVDLISENHVEFRWAAEARNHQARSPYTLTLYSRK